MRKRDCFVGNVTAAGSLSSKVQFGQNSPPLHKTVGSFVRPRKIVFLAGGLSRQIGKFARQVGKFARQIGKFACPVGKFIPSGRKVCPSVRKVIPSGREVCPSGRKVCPSGGKVCPAGRFFSGGKTYLTPKKIIFFGIR